MLCKGLLCLNKVVDQTYSVQISVPILDVFQENMSLLNDKNVFAQKCIEIYTLYYVEPSHI